MAAVCRSIVCDAPAQYNVAFCDLDILVHGCRTHALHWLRRNHVEILSLSAEPTGEFPVVGASCAHRPDSPDLYGAAQLHPAQFVVEWDRSQVFLCEQHLVEDDPEDVIAVFPLDLTL